MEKLKYLRHRSIESAASIDRNHELMGPHLSRHSYPMDLQRLIDSYNEIGSTRCGDAQDYIYRKLAEEQHPPEKKGEWVPNCVTEIYEQRSIGRSLAEHILSLLETYGFLAVDIEAGDPEHAFVLYKSGGQSTIIDAYVGIRKCSSRPLNTDRLKRLFADPSTESWNILFGCEESDVSEVNFVDVTYVDPVMDPFPDCKTELYWPV